MFMRSLIVCCISIVSALGCRPFDECVDGYDDRIRLDLEFEDPRPGDYVVEVRGGSVQIVAECRYDSEFSCQSITESWELEDGDPAPATIEEGPSRLSLSWSFESTVVGEREDYEVVVSFEDEEPKVHGFEVPTEDAIALCREPSADQHRETIVVD